MLKISHTKNCDVCGIVKPMDQYRGFEHDFKKVEGRICKDCRIEMREDRN